MKNPEHTSSLWQKLELPRFPSLDHSTQADVCVIGAGIAGITTAYKLACQGLNVVVLESGLFGNGQTGRTTAHLTYALDDRFFKLQKLHGKRNTKLAVESHVSAIQEISRMIQQENIDCEFLHVDGYLALAPEHQLDHLEKELRAAHECGLMNVRKVSKVPYLSKETSALIFPAQAQFHPLKYLTLLTEAFTKRGGRIFTKSHVVEVAARSKTSVEVITRNGQRVYSDSVVVATNVPINDRVTIHTKQYPYRTYVVGFSVPHGKHKPALLWDTSDPYHYVRTHSSESGDILVVGGEDHKTGQKNDYSECYRNLELWARENISSVGQVQYQWSGQVIEPMDGLAFIGRNPTHSSNIYIATGDSGQGMTHGTIAGMLLTDLILGKSNPWQDVYDPSRMNLMSLGTFIEENANSAAQYKEWFTSGEVDSESDIPMDTGAILRDGFKKIAAYKDTRGVVHKKSAACPHLGGVVAWNGSEKTWDCPCHGSRFDKFGRVIEGPAVSDLAPLKSSEVAQPIPLLEEPAAKKFKKEKASA